MHQVDDDVDSCDADCTANPCSDDEIEGLLEPRSQDRTEDEEERRRAV